MIRAAAFFLLGCVIFGFAVLVLHDSPPQSDGPAVTVVRLPNGQQITCITTGKMLDCDWLGWRSDPSYKTTKP